MVVKTASIEFGCAPDPGPGPSVETECTAESPNSSRSNSRSCYICSSKKIRCDKVLPCAACKRSDRSCSYPPAGPRKRRTKKAMMADMASRLSKLEKLTNQANKSAMSDPKVASPKSVVALPPVLSLDTSPSNALKNEPKGAIIAEAESEGQYFNDIMLSRVIEEERNIESELTNSHVAFLYPPSLSPFNPLGILSSPCLATPPASFYPPKRLAIRLWQRWVANVDAFAGLKMLHVPTAEVKVFVTIDDPAAAPPEDLALNFAIFFGATLSIDAEESLALFGQDKDRYLHQFKLGLEQAFAHGGFLDRPTITGLLALAIYLPVLRVGNQSKGIWILHGLTIRIAHCLGLHRDGAKLGLSPFLVETRRRIWWQLLSRDGRAGEDYGLENTASLLMESDVPLPLNIDDEDLYPDMKQPPRAKAGWTTMTSSLIHIDLSRTTQRLASLAAAATPSQPAREEVRAAVVDEFRARVQQWTQHCNPVIPRQRSTLVSANFSLRKLDFITRLQWTLSRGWRESYADFASERNIVEALEILGPCRHRGDELLRQFAWMGKAYPQYHVTMFVLWYLCIRPEGPGVERAWKVVDETFAEELWDESVIGFGYKATVLADLKAKALRLREKVRGSADQASGAAVERESSNSLKRLGELKSMPACQVASVTGSELGVDDGTHDWLDWEALVQTFRLDSHDGLWQSS